MPLFCRHNRYTAECPICSKGTVLDPRRQVATRRRPPRSAGPGKARRPAAGAAPVRGPYGSAGPYFDGEGYEVRLERVPGGLRLAEWPAGGGSGLRRAAPVLDAADLGGLLRGAAGRGALTGRDAERMLAAAGQARPGRAHGARREAAEGARPDPAEPGAFGASSGRAGDLIDELRVERLDGGRLRIARWTKRPNHPWELQQAPVLLPPSRFAEALERAAGARVLASG